MLFLLGGPFDAVPIGAPSSAAPPSSGSVRNAPEAYVFEPAPDPPPLGHSGFQMAVRSGFALPLGSISRGAPLGDFAAWQVPAIVDIGAKPNHHVFIGGYVGVAFGAVGSSTPCTGDCNVFRVQLGAQIHYHTRPSETVDPWVGYGIGYEWLSTSGSPDQTLRGWDFARLLVGVDWRFSRVFGVGPFVDGALGVYTARTGDPASPSTDRIAESRLHGWVTLGPRLVIMP